ncbi:MAG: nuclear transport factor 2 family protein [Methanoregulaceae archaeon]|nr:nuclear transport factor 2 family protein [Methanoregulaceae archaeon]
MHPVEAQLIAYNAREDEPFMRCFTRDVRILNGRGEVVLEGWDAMRVRYAEAFAKEPDVRCALLHRIHHGDFVVDHEHLTGYRDGTEKHAVAIYCVRDGLIAQVQFL